MKRKDITLIVVVMFVSAVVSLLVSRLLFASPSNRQQAVERVPVITADFPQPDSKYFNPNSIDPTQQIQIGNNNNANPFNGVSQ